MRLIHYSSAPLQEVRSVNQPPVGTDGLVFKPKGLWVSVHGEDDWRTWCESEDFNLSALACETEIILADDPKLLVLTSVADIDAFHNEYATVSLWAGSNFLYPAWTEIAERYNGIVIAPYQWQRRLDGAASNWYYPWDCASGCIWNANAVKELRPPNPSPPV